MKVSHSVNSMVYRCPKLWDLCAAEIATPFRQGIARSPLITFRRERNLPSWLFSYASQSATRLPPSSERDRIRKRQTGQTDGRTDGSQHRFMSPYKGPTLWRERNNG